MNVDKPVYVSAEKLAQLQDELEHLRTVKRKEVADRIHNAMEFGDYSENAELDEAKNEQAFLEGRVLTLEQMVKNAVVIDENGHHEVVELGSHIVVECDGVNENYTIVGSAEANPANGKISNESPIGRALLGHRAGDVVRATVPAGVVEMRIVTVS